MIEEKPLKTVPDSYLHWCKTCTNQDQITDGTVKAMAAEIRWSRELIREAVLMAKANAYGDSIAAKVAREFLEEVGK